MLCLKWFTSVSVAAWGGSGAAARLGTGGDVALNQQRFKLHWAQKKLLIYPIGDDDDGWRVVNLVAALLAALGLGGGREPIFHNNKQP